MWICIGCNTDPDLGFASVYRVCGMDTDLNQGVDPDLVPGGYKLTESKNYKFPS